MEPFDWKAYWLYYGWRWILVLAIVGWGYEDGGWAGAFWATLLAGLILFIIYTVLDLWHRVMRAFHRPTQVNNFNLNVERDVIKGTPVHPDPTRPTAEDYLPMIESYKHRKGIQ